MRKKLCLTMCVLTLAMLTACGGGETETAQSESSTEEVVVETTEEVTEETIEETTEEVVEETVAEPLYDYTEDVAFTIEQNMHVDGIASVDIKTISNFEVIPSDDKDFETGEPAYYMYQTENGTELKFNVGPMYTPESGTNETSTYTNADDVEIIYQITDISNYLYMPLNEEEGMYIRIKVSPVDTENFEIQDYLEITRKCYYIIHEEE